MQTASDAVVLAVVVVAAAVEIVGVDRYSEIAAAGKLVDQIGTASFADIEQNNFEHDKNPYSSHSMSNQNDEA